MRVALAAMRRCCGRRQLAAASAAASWRAASAGCGASTVRSGDCGGCNGCRLPCSGCGGKRRCDRRVRQLRQERRLRRAATRRLCRGATAAGLRLARAARASPAGATGGLTTTATGGGATTTAGRGAAAAPAGALATTGPAGGREAMAGGSRRSNDDGRRRARLRNDLARLRTGGRCGPAAQRPQRAAAAVGRRQRRSRWSGRTGAWLWRASCSSFCFLARMAFSTSPGLEICERSILGVMPCGAREMRERCRGRRTAIRAQIAREPFRPRSPPANWSGSCRWPGRVPPICQESAGS